MSYEAEWRSGVVVIGLVTLGMLGSLGYDLVREAETHYVGVPAGASVSRVDATGGNPRHVVSFPWKGRPKRTTTEWLPAGTQTGATVRVVVNSRRPGFVLADGTGPQRLERYLEDTGFVTLLGLMTLGMRWGRRRMYPDAEPARRWPLVPTYPSRAERRALARTRARRERRR